MFEVKESTIRSIVKKYDLIGNIAASNKGGDYKSVLTDLQKEQIIKWVDENAAIKLSKLKEKVFEEYNLNVSISTIDRALRNFHYTLKDSTIIPDSRNSERTIELRHQYSLRFDDIEVEYSSENIIFWDEVGFQLSTRSKKARSRRGTPARISTPLSRSRNISVMAAMNKNELLFKKVRFSPFNGEVFKESIIELFELCMDKNISNPIFILDNARIHHYTGLNELRSNNRIRLEYLPPYSPFLNPIENVFSIWKNDVIRCQCSSERELIEKIDVTFNQFDNNICENLYRKMKRYIALSRQKEIIYE